MGTRYTWTKALITTENRDRPGGHGHTYAKDGGGWIAPYSPAGAKFRKRKTRHGQRREHARITREAIRSWEQDAYDDEAFERQQAHEMWLAEMEIEENEFYDDYPDDYHENDYICDPYEDSFLYDDWYHGNVEDYYRPEDPHDRIRRAIIYEVITHDGWNFHGPGIGSHAGRKINAHKQDPIPPLVDLMLDSHIEEVIPEPKEEEEFETERVLMEYKDGSLADQLMELAIQVNQLENKKPSLSGFTTDELLEELRSRVK